MSLFSAENLQYLWNGTRYDQVYYWWPIGSHIRAFDWLYTLKLVANFKRKRTAAASRGFLADNTAFLLAMYCIRRLWAEVEGHHGISGSYHDDDDDDADDGGGGSGDYDRPRTNTTEFETKTKTIFRCRNQDLSRDRITLAVVASASSAVRIKRHSNNKCEGYYWSRKAPACLLTLLFHYGKPRLCINIHHYAPQIGCSVKHRAATSLAAACRWGVSEGLRPVSITAALRVAIDIETLSAFLYLSQSAAVVEILF